MATFEINQAKREEMKGLIARAIDLGWRLNELAKLLNVSASAACNYRNGKSMGTNDQRQFLAGLDRPVLTPCHGEAHSNPDNYICGVCTPRWGFIVVTMK